MSNATSLLQIQRLTSLLEYQFIRRDAAGRYNLADIHEMAGRHTRCIPGNWNRNGRVEHLIEAFRLRSSYPNLEPLAVVKTGPRTGCGTFAVEELAILYADWISPEHGQRIREAMASGKSVESDIELKIKALRLMSRTLGFEDAANDAVQPMGKPALIRFVQDYIRTRRVVTSKDITAVLMSVTGEDNPSRRVGNILVQLGCEWRTVGSAKLYLTPLGFESDLSLDSTDNELTQARQEDLDSVRLRLNAASRV